VPEPFPVSVPVGRVHRQLGVDLDRARIAALIGPIGFTVLDDAGAGPATDAAGDGHVTVVVPTNRPDVRPEPFGVDDVIEEIVRTFGYSNVPRHVPTWPQPGRLSVFQHQRRFAKDLLCGLGASEAWTDTFVPASAHERVGLEGEAVRVSNPLDEEKPFLRRTMLPGLLGALEYNASRRQTDIRLFEVGVVFSHPGEGAPRVVERAGAGGRERAELPGEREMLAAVFALQDDDAHQAVAAWHVLSDAFHLDGVRLSAPGSHLGVAPDDRLPPLPGLHPSRSAHLVAHGGATGPAVIGSVGEVDPDVAARFGLTKTTGAGTAARRIGWLEVDLGLLFDESRVVRRVTAGGAVSRFPSSDIDLAFVVADEHPADVVAEAIALAAGDLLESVRLFDVYRGPGIERGTRSLAYHLRFCAADRTLTDDEVGSLRSRCIDALADSFGAVLR
jgi:phenylalanyl-tRNA synthetase beta chain